MRHRTIPQRELRNDIAAILREAEAGTEFTVTVRGRAGREGSCRSRRRRDRDADVDRETLLRIFREIPGRRESWAAELARDAGVAQPPVDDPWNDG